MNTEYLYAMAETFRSHSRLANAMADEAQKDPKLSPRLRDAIAASLRTEASLHYDKAQACEDEARRYWRGEDAA
jgi:hypothetical protein